MISPATALILIDLQQAIDDPAWSRSGPRNHPEAEAAASHLLAEWRAAKRPIFHVRHDSVEPDSCYRPGQPGNRFKPAFEPADGEAVIAKHTGSAFSGTNLEAPSASRGPRGSDRSWSHHQ